MSRERLHMIGNAHIDPVWLWQWPEGYQEVRATFQSAVDRLDEYPEFVFTCDSSLFFAWVEESDPPLFERIREHVANGRFQIVGGWWIEPDCNIPAGESFVRQALYGQRYLHEKFGVVATTGANLDSFGHNATIPQILAKSGCDSYVFLRPGPKEKPDLPAPLFRWASPDGSSVVAYRIPHEYCAPKDDIGEHVEKAIATLPDDDTEYAVFYGVGNHGGGPTIANLEQIRSLNARADVPRLEPSSLRRFFDGAAANGDLPLVPGELQHHSPGCYTTHSGIKRWNRRAENLLLRAEKWSAIAAELGAQPYPAAQLREAWQLVLFNQFHDTLAGTSIEPAYDDARDQLGHASSIAANAFNAATQSLARQIAIEQEEEMRPVVVFNPHPWTLRADAEVEYTWLRTAGAHVVDDEGEAVPMQLTRPLTTMSSARGRLVFPVEVPPLGYRTYRVRLGAVEGEPLRATETTLENDHLLLELDPTTGRIARLVQKATGADVAAADKAHAIVVDDPSDTWGHDVDAYDHELGEFRCTSVRLLETGPVRAILRVESRWGSSTLREDYVLGADVPYVDVRVALDWHEQLKLLKLRYPTSIDAATATFETPYGHIERPTTGNEEPGQSWVDVSGDGRGLTVINDAKYGYDVRGGGVGSTEPPRSGGAGSAGAGAGADIGISAVRSPVWAWHDPRELEEGGDFEYMDQGRQNFLVRLVPHAGDWRAADVVRRAAELNQPPFALIETFHDGPLPQRRAFASDGGGDVVVTALKEAEDGDGWVVRAYESAGRAATAALEVLGRSWSAEFAPHEIKTFLLPADGDPREVNLLEWQ
ncbi:MAG TPA: glycoside hydrolase family 38 C-terminal domain-containing protein [Gaiellaceae bacterium]|nr:glycoside hydrolase family 38 C-terminal domain-containing protein [Gaiellaceae bacterium]